MKDATLEHFAKHKVDLLQAFIHVRKFQDPSFKYPLPQEPSSKDAKDSTRDEKRRTPLLLEMAYKLHNKPVLGGEPSSEPPVLVTPGQRPRVDKEAVLAAQLEVLLPGISNTTRVPCGEEYLISISNAILFPILLSFCQTIFLSTAMPSGRPSSQPNVSSSSSPASHPIFPRRSRRLLRIFNL